MDCGAGTQNVDGECVADASISASACGDGAALVDGACVGAVRVQLIHAVSNPRFAELDVRINGEPVVEGLAYRTATPFLDVAPESEVVVTNRTVDDSEQSGVFKLLPNDRSIALIFYESEPGDSTRSRIACERLVGAREESSTTITELPQVAFVNAVADLSFLQVGRYAPIGLPNLLDDELRLYDGVLYGGAESYTDFPGGTTAFDLWTDGSPVETPEGLDSRRPLASVQTSSGAAMPAGSGFGEGFPEGMVGVLVATGYELPKADQPALSMGLVPPEGGPFLALDTAARIQVVKGPFDEGEFHVFRGGLQIGRELAIPNTPLSGLGDATPFISVPSGFETNLRLYELFTGFPYFDERSGLTEVTFAPGESARVVVVSNPDGELTDGDAGLLEVINDTTTRSESAGVADIQFFQVTPSVELDIAFFDAELAPLDDSIDGLAFGQLSAPILEDTDSPIARIRVTPAGAFSDSDD